MLGYGAHLPLMKMIHLAGDVHLGNCSMRRLKRLLLVLYLLHGPGQYLDPGYARKNCLTFSMQS
jgi:hypothetical protein